MDDANMDQLAGSAATSFVDPECGTSNNKHASDVFILFPQAKQCTVRGF